MIGTFIWLGVDVVDDSPAERLLLAKSALEREQSDGPLVRLLLYQGLREPEWTVVNLVVQVDLLQHMVDRGLIRTQPSDRDRIRSLSERTDALIYERSDVVLVKLFCEYDAIASELLSRAEARPVPNR